LVLASFVFWTLYADWSQYNLDQFGDMLENYAWGIRWQLGNPHHPPLFGWITAAWFLVFPRTDVAYHTLGAANIAASLLVMLQIAKRYLDASQLVLSIAVALALPLLGFMSITYNANSAMTPFWALTVLAYLRVLERRRPADAFLLGVFAALAMLAKYYSAVLLLALLVHSIVDRETRPLWQTRLPLIALGAFALVLLPHVVWLVENDFAPFVFAVAEQGDRTVANIAYREVEFATAQILYGLPGLAVLGLYRRPRDGCPLFDLRQFMTLAETQSGRALLAAGLLPVPLTMILGLVLWVPLTSNWSVPFFIFTPILLILLLPKRLADRRPRTAPVFAAIFMAVLLALTPVIRNAIMAQGRNHAALPVAEIAAKADAIWREQTDKPLKFVGGDAILSHGMAFYSAFQPHAIRGADFEARGWIEPGAVERSGAMVLCLTPTCVDEAISRQAGAIRKQVAVAAPAGSTADTFDVTVLLRVPKD
jgi:4-amino-4-deoxy-L-arabinose transferase-like glycosyltransferase